MILSFNRLGFKQLDSPGLLSKCRHDLFDASTLWWKTFLFFLWTSFVYLGYWSILCGVYTL